MQLNLYPMDTQTCRIRFSASRYRYESFVNDIILSNFMIETISDGLKVNLQKFNGEIYRAEEIMYSKGALQYRIDLEKYPDLAYRTDSCTNGGESTNAVLTVTIFRPFALQRSAGRRSRPT